jgi:hypothetical protein
MITSQTIMTGIWSPPLMKIIPLSPQRGGGGSGGCIFTVKKPKTAIVIPRSLRRGISSIRYYYAFSFYEEIPLFYEGIIIASQEIRLSGS